MTKVFERDPPRVFISYTRRCRAQDEADHRCTPATCESSVELAASLANALEARGFIALWDASRLEVGEPWRPDLVEMLDTCDAGVVLLSGPALESDWVRQESTILKFRHDSTGLPLLPVALPGLDRERLAHGPFAPLDLEALQMLAATGFTEPIPGVEALVDLLVERFADWTADLAELKLKRHIRAKLSIIEENLLDLMMDELHITRGWIRHDSLRRLYVREVADALLEVDIDRAAQALGTLVTHIDEHNLTDVLGWVEPFWVDPRAAHAIRSNPQGRAFAINGTRGPTAVAYLARAACNPGPWVHVTVLAINGEEQQRELKEAIVTALADTLLVQPAEVPLELAYVTARAPVFVVVSDHVPAPILAALVADEELRGVSFLVLTGDDRFPGAPDWPDALELVEPPLRPGEESRADLNCRRARRNLQVIINQARPAQAAAS